MVSKLSEAVATTRLIRLSTVWRWPCSPPSRMDTSTKLLHAGGACALTPWSVGLPSPIYFWNALTNSDFRFRFVNDGCLLWSDPAWRPRWLSSCMPLRKRLWV